MSTYATCDYCGREMVPTEGCLFRFYQIDGKIYQRDTSNLGEQQVCHDCNAPLGQPHHPGCDNERCPVCGRQAIGCGHLNHATLLEKAYRLAFTMPDFSTLKIDTAKDAKYLLVYRNDRYEWKVRGQFTRQKSAEASFKHHRMIDSNVHFFIAERDDLQSEGVIK